MVIAARVIGFNFQSANTALGAAKLAAPNHGILAASRVVSISHVKLAGLRSAPSVPAIPFVQFHVSWSQLACINIRRVPRSTSHSPAKHGGSAKGRNRFVVNAITYQRGGFFQRNPAVPDRRTASVGQLMGVNTFWEAIS
jgi:hypothetical protein